MYSWGNGANYQLGIGTAGIQRIPCRLDALQNLDVTHVAAAKFHSAAVTASGDVYTWGFGRGGRLGHPDFDIHRFALTSCDTSPASSSGMLFFPLCRLLCAYTIDVDQIPLYVQWASCCYHA